LTDWYRKSSCLVEITNQSRDDHEFAHLLSHFTVCSVAERRVEKKANKQWIWLAMDAKSRQIIAFHVGDRSRESAKALWANIPEVYQHHATFHTDQYDVYTGVIPAERHKAISKKARKTNHIERFNNTLRQRVSRLVREALSFSKKLANHIGAIKFFICHYNLEKVAALPL
jgi:insertion element IS1 protein InsB